MRFRKRWLGLLILGGLATGLVLGAWAFGLDDVTRVRALLPSTGALGAAITRAADGTPLPTDLLAAACIAAVAALILRDGLLAWQDRRRHRWIRALAAGK